MRSIAAAGVVLAGLVHPHGRQAHADDDHQAVRGLALSELPDLLAAAQLDVGTRLLSVGGVLGVQTVLGLGLGRGFALEASAAMEDGAEGPEMERAAAVGATLGYRWAGGRQLSEIHVGARQGVGASEVQQVRAGVGLRTTGSSWAAASLELGLGDRFDGALAAAVGAGRGPIVPALEVRLGRCEDACAMGSAGVRVRLPGAFELGLAVVGEALPARHVGMALSFVWTSELAQAD